MHEVIVSCLHSNRPATIKASHKQLSLHCVLTHLAYLCSHIAKLNAIVKPLVTAQVETSLMSVSTKLTSSHSPSLPAPTFLTSINKECNSMTAKCWEHPVYVPIRSMPSPKNDKPEGNVWKSAHCVVIAQITSLLSAN